MKISYIMHKLNPFSLSLNLCFLLLHGKCSDAPVGSLNLCLVFIGFCFEALALSGLILFLEVLDLITLVSTMEDLVFHIFCSGINYCSLADTLSSFEYEPLEFPPMLLDEAKL